MDEALVLLGRLHVVVLHLPIGILVALGLIELWSWWRKRDAPEAAWSLALFGSVSAVTTAVLGVLLSWDGNYEPTLLFRHKWLGIAVAASSIVVCVLKAKATESRAYRAALSVCLILLVAGGHQGGSLTHGTEFLFASAPSVETIDTAPAALVLETHCYECHGSTQQESGLRLDERDAMLAGGESGEPAVVPGRATASEMIRRVTLPRADDEAMPPDGRGRLSADEMLMLIDWINGGASLTQPIEIEAAADEAIDELVALGIEIERLSETDPRLAVSLQFTAGDAVAEPLLRLDRVASQITWLSLKGTTLSEAEWAQLERFENLTRLHAEGTNVEDRHLAYLEAAVHLEYLNLYGTNVGDDGIAYLMELPKLTDLYVWRTRVSDEAAAALTEKEPAVRVHRGVAGSSQ